MSHEVPNLAANNSGNCGAVHSKFSGYGFLGHSRFVLLSYFKNRGIVKLGRWGAGAKAMPFLGLLVGHVVLMSSKKKMVRIAASWIVAFMENMKRPWVFSSENHPAKSSCSVQNPTGAGNPIPAFIAVSNPVPAIAIGWCLDFAKKVIEGLIPVLCHIRKTPTNIDVRPAQCCGTNDDGYKYGFTVFSRLKA